MGNSILAIFDGATGIIRIVIIVFVCLAVIGALVTLPGLPQEAKAIAEQTSNSISWLVIFYIGLPSVGIILVLIAFAFWIKKKFDENNSYNL